MGLPGQRLGSRDGDHLMGSPRGSTFGFCGGGGARCSLHVLAPTPASCTQAACRSLKPPSLLLGGAWVWPGFVSFRLPDRMLGSLFLLCRDREDSHPCPATDPCPTWRTDGAQYISLGGGCPLTPLGSGCVFLGIPQQCKERDTAMGGVFTTLSTPFSLWGPQLYSQWYSSPTQYFYV